MKKLFFSLVLVMSIGLVFSLKSEDVQQVQNDKEVQAIQTGTPNVAWAMYEMTNVEPVAEVMGSGAAIGTYQVVTSTIKGAKWGARIGKFAGPWGCLAGMVVGGL